MFRYHFMLTFELWANGFLWTQIGSLEQPVRSAIHRQWWDTVCVYYVCKQYNPIAIVDKKKTAHVVIKLIVIYCILEKIWEFNSISYVILDGYNSANQRFWFFVQIHEVQIAVLRKTIHGHIPRPFPVDI